MELRDIKEEDVKNLKNLLEFLNELSKDGITPLIEKQVLQMLENTMSLFCHLILIRKFSEIHRLTVNRRVLSENKRIRKIAELKYPPKEKVEKYGRCNLPKQSILYASIVNLTTLNELKPRIGDLITESTWRAKGNSTLTYCPIFKNQPQKENYINPRTLEINKLFEKKVTDYPVNIQVLINTFVQFIADAFTKKVFPSNHLDYIFSAYFSDKIFNSFINGTIEAIYYPSVQDDLSFENLAIKPEVFDKKYDLINVKDSVVVADLSVSEGYFMEGLSDCNSFDFASGKILWDKHRLYQSQERVEQLKHQFNVHIEE